jgi:Leucine-rich repeat (LRR) protein
VKLDISEYGLLAKGTKMLAEALIGNQVITELNIAGNASSFVPGKGRGQMAGIGALAAAIPTMGALTSLNISKNDLGEMCKGPLPKGWKSKDDDHDAPWLRIADGHEQDEHPGEEKPWGAIAIANAIPTMGTLTKLILGGDKVHSWDSKAPEPAALAVGMSEADLSNKNLGAGGAIIVGAWISHKDDGALVKVDISNNHIRAEGGTALAGALKGNNRMKELNIASNDLCNTGTQMDGVIAVADAIPTMGGLAKLTCGGEDYFNGNEFVTPEPATLEVGMTEADFSNMRLQAGGAIIVGAWMTHKDHGTLTRLNMSHNMLATKASGKVLAGMLSSNSVLKELDVSKNAHCPNGRSWGDASGRFWAWADGPGFANELAVGLSSNDALTSLNISKNRIGELVLPEGWTHDRRLFGRSGGYKHTDGRKEKQHPGKPEGSIAIANAIPTMGALTSLNLLKNRMEAEGVKAIVNAWKASKCLTSICGATGPELDLSGQHLRGWGDIPIVCAEIENNGALEKFDISGNTLYREGTKLLAEALRGNQRMVELNLARNGMGSDGAMAIAKTSPTMEALTSLNMSHNMLATRAAGKALSEMLRSNSVLKELDASKNAQNPSGSSLHGADGPGFATELAVGIGVNAALTSLDISNNELVPEHEYLGGGQYADPDVSSEYVLENEASLPDDTHISSFSRHRCSCGGPHEQRDVGEIANAW